MWHMNLNKTVHWPSFSCDCLFNKASFSLSASLLLDPTSWHWSAEMHEEFNAFLCQHLHCMSMALSILGPIYLCTSLCNNSFTTPITHWLNNHHSLIETLLHVQRFPLWVFLRNYPHTWQDLPFEVEPHICHCKKDGIKRFSWITVYCV